MKIARADVTLKVDPVWDSIVKEVALRAQAEPLLASFFHATVLNHDSLEAALSFHLANKLDSPTMPAMLVREVIEEAFASDHCIRKALRADISAVRERDPACDSYATPLLYFKGFHSLQLHRVAHWLWQQRRSDLALFLQNRCSETLGVDIHPAAQFGRGILIDHATGIVVGETAVVGNNVSLLQSVTLGGTGKETGDRHPKIRDGVLVSAGAKILGNVVIGEGAKVGSGSVVLNDVPAHATVAGVPAKVVGYAEQPQPALAMDHSLPDGCD